MKHSPRTLARRRAKKQAALRHRYGADRFICPKAITLCNERLADYGCRLNIAGGRELFWSQQRILHTGRAGARLPLGEFSSPKAGQKVRDGLCRIGLVSCVNPDSWRASWTGERWDFADVDARRYIPSSELLIANAGAEVVNNVADYLAGRFQQRRITDTSTVKLAPESQVAISSETVSRLENGTGLCFQLEKALRGLGDLEELDRAKTLRACQSALGWLGNSAPIHTHWRQTESGRLYSSDPAVINVPRVMRTGWVATDGGHVGVVDFQNFEIRLLFSEADLEPPLGDFAQYLANELELERADVKAVLNAALHGQTEGHLRWVGNWHLVMVRRKVQALIQGTWPAAWRKLDSFKLEPGFLQRRGAQVFVRAYETAVLSEDINAGIPMHDGWIFPATGQAQVNRVKAIFEQESERLLCCPIPVTAMLLN